MGRRKRFLSVFDLKLMESRLLLRGSPGRQNESVLVDQGNGLKAINIERMKQLLRPRSQRFFFKGSLDGGLVSQHLGQLPHVVHAALDGTGDGFERAVHLRVLLPDEARGKKDRDRQNLNADHSCDKQRKRGGQLRIDGTKTQTPTVSFFRMSLQRNPTFFAFGSL
jgi:hypothetical protein